MKTIMDFDSKSGSLTKKSLPDSFENDYQKYIFYNDLKIDGLGFLYGIEYYLNNLSMIGTRFRVAYQAVMCTTKLQKLHSTKCMVSIF